MNLSKLSESYIPGAFGESLLSSLDGEWNRNQYDECPLITRGCHIGLALAPCKSETCFSCTDQYFPNFAR